jgi:hypothetical protein
VTFAAIAAKRHRPVWTPERRCRLSRLLIDGLSYGKAAKVLGVPRGSVCWAAARYGIQRAPADTSRATGQRAEDWFDARLTERWADRRGAA